jgi:hypothetical protein
MRYHLPLLLLLSLNLSSQEPSSNFQLSPGAAQIAGEISDSMEKLDFHSLKGTGRGISSLDVDEAYIQDENKFIIIKHDLEGELELNKMIKAPKGLMIQFKENSQTYMLYFRGFRTPDAKAIAIRLSKRVVRWQGLESLFFPRAYAACEDMNATNIFPQAGPIHQLQSGMQWEMVKQCLRKLGDGLSGEEKPLKKDWSNKAARIRSAEAAADEIETFFRRSKAFTYGLVQKPSTTMAHLHPELTGDAWDRLSDRVDLMPAAERSQFVCQFMQTLGADDAITLFVHGKLSQSARASIKEFAEKQR